MLISNPLYASEGVVLDRSTEFQRGHGTKLYPTWLVEGADGRRLWLNGIDLTKIK